MKIGIDIDDTITDTYCEVLKFVSDTLEIDYEELKAQKLNYDEIYDGKLYVPMRDEIFNHFYLIVPKIKVKPDAIEVLTKLKDEGNEIILITARSHTYPGQNEEFLKNAGIPYTKLYEKAKKKAEIAKEENIDLFIDDSVNNCKAVKNEKIKVLLFDAPFNEREKTLKRVRSWKEVYSIINKR